MGTCYTTNTNIIDLKMKENEDFEKQYHKLLFLGPGGGGKSTIFKQLQWLHGGGFTDFALETFKHHIHLQITRQMQYAIKHYLSEPTSDTQLQNEINSVRDGMPSCATFESLCKSVSYIWRNDARLKGIFNDYDPRLKMWPSTEYFWDALPRVSAADYKPTKVDVIKVRNMSSGVVQKRFQVKGCKLHIFDVGGQKSERKKWMLCFDNVSVVVFVAALSCYNEVMFEDNSTNCMVDAIQLFDKTINDPQFVDKPIILFLNKTDLFRRTIKELPITVCPALKDFDDKVVYDERRQKNTDDESHHFHQCATFIKLKFEEKNRTRKRCIYTHFTCAMDDENVNHVFNDIVSVMLGEMAQIIESGHLL